MRTRPILLLTTFTALSLSTLLMLLLDPVSFRRRALQLRSRAGSLAETARGSLLRFLRDLEARGRARLT
jgi:hypothetical protein